VDFGTTLKLISSALPAESGEWAVIGGVAVGLRGCPRTTLDVDILVRRDALPRLDEVLLGHGYELEFRWDETSHYRPPIGPMCAIDALHAHREYALGMLDRAEVIGVGERGLVIPVVETEDLFGLKLQAMVNDPCRERAESADLRALLESAAASRRPLDRTRLDEYFALFDRSSLLEELLENLDAAVR